MKKYYYISLVGPFIGMYLEVAVCPGIIALELSDNAVIRLWANQILGPKVWCSIYTREEIGGPFQVIGKTVIISDVFQNKVEFDYQ